MTQENNSNPSESGQDVRQFKLLVNFTGVNHAERSFAGFSDDEGLMLAEFRRWKDYLQSPYIASYHLRLLREEELIMEDFRLKQ